MNTLNFHPQVVDILNDPSKRVTVLTGAGISAESGIPTFRGPEGYWTVGSRVYMPQEIATLQMFMQHPRDVWEWYLYRLGVCLHAQPNPGHLAIAEIENKLTDRFCLITQNIDNLHIRAGNSLERTYQIHGNINYTRCTSECKRELFELPDVLKITRNSKGLNEAELELLKCQYCHDWLRPHVLWFDEYYNEEYFRFDSSVAIAAMTDLLIIVGTSGATALPNHVVSIVAQSRGTIIDINIEESPFSSLAENSPYGKFIKNNSTEILPLLTGLCD